MQSYVYLVSLRPLSIRSGCGLFCLVLQRVLGSQVVMKTVEWGGILVYSALYWLEIPIMEKYRAYPPANGWPWKSPNPEVRKGKAVA